MPATNWQERVDPEEAQRFERYAEQLREMQRKNARGGAPSRALHAKGQLGLTAEFSVLPDLPEHARVGPFAKPGVFRAYVRYSNGAGRRQSDAKPDVRGVAVKLLGVEGKKIIPGLENARTQDFLMIRSSVTPFRTADEFVPFVQAAVSPLTGLPRVIGRLGLGRTLQILRSAMRQLGQPLGPLAETRWYSAVPIQFGKHAVRYSLNPRAAASGTALTRSPDMLADEMAGRLRKGLVEYDFQVQFFVDERSTPIEDASVEWEAPWLTIGRLTLPVQDVSSEQGRKTAELVETLSFDPWHAVVELRPLGSMMRARNHAYRLSTQERRAAPEPE
jgi:hypothetical protein